MPLLELAAPCTILRLRVPIFRVPRNHFDLRLRKSGRKVNDSFMRSESTARGIWLDERMVISIEDHDSVGGKGP